MQATALCDHCKLLNVINPNQYSYCSRCNRRIDEKSDNPILTISGLMILAALGAFVLNAILTAFT